MSKSIYDNYFWIPFRNDSGETIPAYSSLKITGVVSGGARITLTCDKPDNSTCTYAASGPFAVPVDGYGSACVSSHRIVKVSASVSTGDEIGPVGGSWESGDGGNGMMVYGMIDATKNLALVSLLPKAETCGQDSSSSYGSSYCVSIPGVDLDAIELVDAVDADYVLAIRNGCLVKVALTECGSG
jgi:hypothetical protein